MKKVWLLCAALALSTSPAFAAKWKVDPAKSSLNFVGLEGGKEFTGGFGKWTADIDYDPAKLDAASIKVTVDTGSADAKDEMRNGHINDEDWFNSSVLRTRSLKWASRSFSASRI